MVLQVHDELVVEVDECDLATVPKIVHDIMSTTYKHNYLPLTCSMEWSDKSMADKKKGFPV
jgi:DNA polymerase I-like protein with 3'-5' exonuclease and polymerase domains